MRLVGSKQCVSVTVKVGSVGLRKTRAELTPIEASMAEGLNTSRYCVERDEYDAWMELELCDCDDPVNY